MRIKVNLPNVLTLSRVPILFVITGLLHLHDMRWAATVAFVLFVLGGVTDWLDGYIARRLKMVSNFGKLMDALTDKVLMVGLCTSLLGESILPRWAVFLVLLIIAREFLITGLRLVAASQGMVLAAERSGKIKTVMQIVSIGTLLCAHALKKDFALDLTLQTAEVMQAIGMALFIGATLLTVASGTGYLVKYWRVFMGEPKP